MLRVSKLRRNSRETLARLEPFRTTLPHCEIADRVRQTALDVTNQYPAFQQAKNGEASAPLGADEDTVAGGAAHVPRADP
ncbi:hypothetical protein GCM10011415_01870 [Salipiger pallidus]|uniref:Uncharacterized protein n=1 Tax=Salipiger pallidus TaxID=1775170 RepID=A0A8J2ZFZ7_9RHOB|nr:hypothetical protein GCM10011415_01870 [Salipiger pallidus]